MMGLRRDELEKRQRLFGQHVLSGPIWTSAEGHPLSPSQIARLVSHVLKAANCPYKRPYLLKSVTATALHAAGIPLDDVARFIRHDPASGNLERFYISNDLGKSCAEKIAGLAGKRVCSCYI
jgi:site-specific recombinase XerD